MSKVFSAARPSSHYFERVVTEADYLELEASHRLAVQVIADLQLQRDRLETWLNTPPIAEIYRDLLAARQRKS